MKAFGSVWNSIRIQNCMLIIALSVHSKNVHCQSCVPSFGQTRILRTVATDVNEPRDLKFHPLKPTKLWVASSNYTDSRRNRILIIRGAGDPNQQSITSLRDRTAYHYLDGLSAIGFSNDGKRLYTCQESNNTYAGMQTTYFMGPTAYEVCSVSKKYLYSAYFFA